MEIFNVGPLEFLFILLLAFIVLGPEGSLKTARQAGRLVYRIVRSPLWAYLLKTSEEVRDLPRQIVREAGMEESLKDLQNGARQFRQEAKQVGEQINADLQMDVTPRIAPPAEAATLRPPAPNDD